MRKLLLSLVILVALPVSVYAHHGQAVTVQRQRVVNRQPIFARRNVTIQKFVVAPQAIVIPQPIVVQQPAISYYTVPEQIVVQRFSAPVHVQSFSIGSCVEFFSY